MKNIGENIRAARKALGMSQEALAERLDVTTQAVSTWERGENVPETRKLLALARELRVSLDSLMGDGGSSPCGAGSVLDRAIAYASAKHSGATRKGTNVPYIVHPMEAAAIVSALTDDEEVIAAAVLHDVLEDTDTAYGELEKAFGSRIAGLVAEESEDKRRDRPADETWARRKAEALLRLRNSGHEAKLVALGDKLASIRAIERDYEKEGESFWERFNEKDKSAHGRYYGGVLLALEKDPQLSGSPLLREYAARVRGVFGDGAVGGPEEKDRRKEEGAPAALPEKYGGNDLTAMAYVCGILLRLDDAGFGGVRFTLSNDPKAEDVVWERTEDGYGIRLCAASEKHWCQVCYQLGYAMAHCLIDRRDPEKPPVVWAEELICEAAALYLLKLLAEHWEKTPFFAEDPDYGRAIRKYIDDTLSDRGTGKLTRCPDREALQALNNANRFEDRINESHDLFASIRDGDLQLLAQVRRYAADGLLLYTRSWRRRSGNSRAVDYVCRLQEQIPQCDLPVGASVHVALEDAEPSPGQREAFADMIRALRALPHEYAAFSFMDDDKGDCEQIGLVFYRVTRMKDGQVLAEMRLDTKAGRKMYRLRCGDERAVGILNEILDTNAVPDLAGWDDVTETIPS